MGAVSFLLVVNVGSTSVKLALFAGADPGRPAWYHNAPLTTDADDRLNEIAEEIRRCPEPIGAIGAVGHRIVHGGSHFDAPVVINASVERAIETAAEYAPLHNRAGLDGIAAARQVVGMEVPHVAVFDTAFHRSITDPVAAYGGPFGWLEAGLRRYGFHGISHQDAARRSAALLQRPLDEVRLITCHLGGGCSMTAIDQGHSVDTTMGLTPLDGLVMATRSGSVDPGLVFHLLRQGATVAELEDTLEYRSGLAGLSGISGDLRAVLDERDRGNERAKLAVDVFVHRAASGVGAMVAALGGLDGLVFTGAIGEHSAEVRARIVERFAFLGATIDHERNISAASDGIISTPDANIAIMVITAQEEVAIAREVALLLSPDEPAGNIARTVPT